MSKEELLERYPAFRSAIEAAPEAYQSLLEACTDPQLAAERDRLLVETAALWQKWNDLGAKLNAAISTSYVM